MPSLRELPLTPGVAKRPRATKRIRPFLEDLERREVLSTVIHGTGVPVYAYEDIPFTGEVATFLPTDFNQGSKSPINLNLPNITLSDLKLVKIKIDWGDHTTSDGWFSLKDLSVNGTHTYTDVGTYKVDVTIKLIGITVAKADTTATVSEPPVVARGVDPICTSQGVPTGNVKVAGFYDPAGPDTTQRLDAVYSATIDWGDGTKAKPDVTAGTIVLNPDGKTFSVLANHTYYAPGCYRATVTIYHNDTEPQVVYDSIYVKAQNDINVHAADLAGNPGQPFDNVVVGTFTDGYPFTDTGAPTSASSYCAMIDWGDGSPASVGTITASPLGGYVVKASHSYDRSGDYQLSLTVHKLDAKHDTGEDTGSVHIAATTIDVTPVDGTAVKGTTYTKPVAMITTNDWTIPAGAFSAVINWSDGTSQKGTVSGTNGVFTVVGAYDFSKVGQYVLSVKVAENVPAKGIQKQDPPVPTVVTVRPTIIVVDGLLKPTNTVANVTVTPLVTTDPASKKRT